jgi:hypothetical protein
MQNNKKSNNIIKPNGFYLSKRPNLNNSKLINNFNNLYSNKRTINSMSINAILNEPVAATAGESSRAIAAAITDGGTTSRAIAAAITDGGETPRAIAAAIAPQAGAVIPQAPWIAAVAAEGAVGIPQAPRYPELVVAVRNNAISYESLDMNLLTLVIAAAILGVFLYNTSILRASGVPVRDRSPDREAQASLTNLHPPVSSEPSVVVIRVPDELSQICDWIENLNYRILYIANQHDIAAIPPGFLDNLRRVIFRTSLLQHDLGNLINTQSVRDFMNRHDSRLVEDYTNWHGIFTELLGTLQENYTMLLNLFF